MNEKHWFWEWDNANEMLSDLGAIVAIILTFVIGIGVLVALQKGY